MAAYIDHEIMGLPKNGLIFFFGIRLLPPRAGITQILVMLILKSLLGRKLPLIDLDQSSRGIKE